MATMSEDVDDSLDMYRELALLASHGVDEYLAVIAELLDASILLNGLPCEISQKAETWAEEIADEVSQKNGRTKYHPALLHSGVDRKIAQSWS